MPPLFGTFLKFSPINSGFAQMGRALPMSPDRTHRGLTSWTPFFTFELHVSFAGHRHLSAISHGTAVDFV